MKTNAVKKRLTLNKETIVNLEDDVMLRIRAMGGETNDDSIELDVEPIKTNVSCEAVTCPPDPGGMK